MKFGSLDLLNVKDVNTDISVSVFPNPVNEVLQIQRDNGNFALINILDSRGVFVKSLNTFSIVTDINVIDLSSGIYFVEVKEVEGSKVLKFIKE